MRYALGVSLMGSALIAVSADAQTQNVRTFLQTADTATGASKVNNVQYTGTGWIGFIGQNFSTIDDWPRVDLQTYTNTIDYGSASSKEEYVRVQGNNPARGGGAGFPIQGAPRTTNFVTANSAWTLNAMGGTQNQDDQTEIRKLMIAVSPHGFIKSAMADRNAQVTTRHFVRTGQTFRVVGFTTMDKYRATAEFNEQNLPERVVTWIPNPVMGDMQVEIRYENWRDVGNGVKFPGLIHMHQGDHPFVRGMNFMNLNVSDVKVNIPNAVVSLPDSVRNGPEATVVVTSRQISPGVWFIAGGSHNSVAVEFKDFITVVEGPLNDARSNAVIAEAKRIIPNKPIKYLVNTHHHWDHAGGIRAFAAEGATIVTNEQNKEFFEKVVLAPQPRTLSPDRLSMFPFATTGPGPLKLETYTERHTISDGTMTLTSHHIEGLNHAGDMAIVYLPGPKIAINGDLWGPPAAGGNVANVNPNAVALFRNIERLKLDIATHVPIHGNPGPQADFQRIVGPVAAAARPAGGGGGD